MDFRHTMEYYKAFKRKEMVIHDTTRKNPGDILSEMRTSTV
jgi:hypothetical protein